MGRIRSVEMKFMRAFVTLCSLAFGSRGCEGQGGEILNVCSFVVYLLQNPLHASEDFSRWQVLAVGPKEGDVETACCQQVLLLTIRFAQLALDAVAVCGMLEMALWNANKDAYLHIVCAAENGVGGREGFRAREQKALPALCGCRAFGTSGDEGAADYPFTFFM